MNEARPFAVQHEEPFAMAEQSPYCADAMRVVGEVEAELAATDGVLDWIRPYDVKNAIRAAQGEPLEEIDKVIGRFLSVVSNYDQLKESASGHIYAERPSLEIATEVITDTGLEPGQVEALYDNPDSQFKKYIAQQVADVAVTQDERSQRSLDNILSVVYNAKGKDRFLLPKGEDPLVDMRYPETMFINYVVSKLPAESNYDPQNPLEYEDKMVGLARTLLVDRLGLSTDIWRKYSPNLVQKVTTDHMSNRLLRAANLVRQVPAEQLETLHEAFETVNLDEYKPEDLHVLQGILNKDEATIEYLKKGDVTVVFRDAYGDSNGAFQWQFDNYRRDSGRSLMFEVARPSDIYRRFALLKQLGIRPSTISFGVHGVPGGAGFGSLSGPGESFIVGTHNYTEDARKNPTEEEPVDALGRRLIDISKTQLDRLVAEYMQPSETAGQRTVILDLCSSDVAYKDGLSLMETVVRKANKDDFVGYGTSEDELMQSERVPGAVGFRNVAGQPIGRSVRLGPNNFGWRRWLPRRRGPEVLREDVLSLIVDSDRNKNKTGERV